MTSCTQSMFILSGIFCVCLIFTSDCFAYHPVGWHFYDEIKTIRQHKKLNKKTVLNAAPSAMTQLNELRKAVREAKARAVLYPTESNLKTYIILQNYLMHNAAVFSQVWQRTLLDYPTINYAVLHPTENNAQHILYSEETRREDAVIANYRNEYGMFFFYRGKNPLDRELAPSIVSFAKDNKLSLIPISVDGKILKNVPGSRVDQGQAAKLHIKYFPALILVNPKTQQVKPLNYGFIAQDELKKRFLQVATNFRDS